MKKNFARVSCAKLIGLSHPFRRCTSWYGALIVNTINLPRGITMLDGINACVELSRCFPWGITTKLQDGGSPHVEGLIYFGG
jgi:hypothetical protein